MPPSFPYGGMENPQITYVTPTLLAGDRSLANVVAHEVGTQCLQPRSAIATLLPTHILPSRERERQR